MSRRQGKAERRIIFTLNKILNVIVNVRNQSSVAVVDAAIDSASASIEELKQIYLADRAERKARHEAFGFDFNQAEDQN